MRIAAVLVPVLLAGCTLPARDSTNDVDRRRAEVMRTDPAYAGAPTPPRVELGWASAGPHDWRRPNVSARLATWPAVPARQVRERAAQALADLRTGGWKVLWARCTPPLPAPVRYDGAAPPPLGEAWTWLAVGYRIRDGVSYGFMLMATARPDADGWVKLDLVAPHHFDRSNLFPDEPAGLPPGGTCVERDLQPDRAVEDGTYLEVTRHHVADDPAPHPSRR